jgi:hypothetical protein
MIKEFSLTLMVLVVTGAVAWSADFEIEVRVSVPDAAADHGMATNRLVAGGRTGATEGFDTLFDVPALFYDETLKAAFPHPELPQERQSLWKDIRTDQLPLSWAFEVSSNRDQRPVTLQWVSTVGAVGCEGVHFNLTDEGNGQVIDMGVATNYTYMNDSQRKRRFLLQAEATQNAPPQNPGELWSPRYGRGGVLLTWSIPISGGDVGYRIYRRQGTGSFMELITAPLTENKYLDRGVAGGDTYTYKVTAVSPSGCESGTSNELAVAIP